MNLQYLFFIVRLFDWSILCNNISYSWCWCWDNHK